MPDAWVANLWHVSLSPTTRPLLVELECSARGVLLPPWSSFVCGGMSCLRRAQVGSTPQDYPQESLWSVSMPSYMVVQQPLTTINCLDSTSRMYWMVRRFKNHSECRGHSQNPRCGPGHYCETDHPSLHTSSAQATMTITIANIANHACLVRRMYAPLAKWMKNLWGICLLQPCEGKHHAIPQETRRSRS